jgi:peptidoglycan DL-endopeptidase CwlO
MTLALGFLTLAGGLVLAIAGVTGSSVPSVVKGHPDHAKGSPELAGVEGSAEAGSESPAGVSGAAAAGGGGASALKHAVSQLGVKYAWGGEAERVAFDCSGLVQWAFGKAGVSLPRTAAEQYKATSRISPAEAGAGDLIFFGSGSEVSHVGILTGPGVMIDAPHTGAEVRYDHVPMRIGAAWGSDRVIGFGRA